MNSIEATELINNLKQLMNNQNVNIALYLNDVSQIQLIRDNETAFIRIRQLLSAVFNTQDKLNTTSTELDYIIAQYVIVKAVNKTILDLNRGEALLEATKDLIK